MSDQTTNDLPASRALCASTPPPETLDQIELGLLKAATSVVRKNIEAGLFILKGHAHFALSESARTGPANAARKAKAASPSNVVPLWDNVASPTVEPQSFDAWLADLKERKVVGFSRTSAYRHMQAAVLLGLTHLSSAADVANIPESQITAIRASLGSPSGLALPEPAPEKAPLKGPNEKPIPPHEKAAQLWLPFFEELGTLTHPDAKDIEYLAFLPALPDPANPSAVNLQSLESRLETALAEVRRAKAAAKSARR